MKTKSSAAVQGFALIAFAALAGFLAAGNAAAQASPCDGIDRSLTLEQRVSLATAVARQLRARGLPVAKVRIIESFRTGGWTVLSVETHVSDNGFLFYAADPRTSPYIAVWGGEAAPSERQSITDWTLKNAPGIPDRLASCFAWHVTEDPDY